MTNLSISLSNDIAQASNETAKKLGISRTEFIRQAVIHELKTVQSKLEQNEIIQCFNTMKTSKMYIAEAEGIMSELDINISEEKDEWWNNK
jgi:metal-responsive CopG/Arc/MetJ family transcriptional regulator